MARVVYNQQIVFAVVFVHMGQYMVVKVDLRIPAVPNSSHGTSEPEASCENRSQETNLPL